MRTWSESDPKARLMARKRRAIVDAALDAFLAEGYAGSSVNRIAAAAGVSITTLYRHFESKDDLFIAVVDAACANPRGHDDDPEWIAMDPLPGLEVAGRELLANVLSAPQLALFRVVARDAQRFPELGRRHQEEIVGRQVALFGRHLSRWPADLRAKVRDPRRAAHVFSALLKAEIFDMALLGGPVPDEPALHARAREAAENLLELAEAGRL